MRCFALILLSACLATGANAATAPRATLKPFASESEFDALVKGLRVACGAVAALAPVARQALSRTSARQRMVGSIESGDGA